MKNYLISFFLGGLIGAVVTFYVVRHQPTESGKVTTSFIAGKVEQEYIKGEVTEKRTRHEDKSTVVKKPVIPAEDSSIVNAWYVEKDSSVIPFEFTEIDSTGTLVYSDSLEVTTYPGVDSVKLKRKFEYYAVEKSATDTIKQSRTDTLQTSTEIEKPRKFYDNFWAGAATATTVVAAILLIFK